MAGFTISNANRFVDTGYSKDMQSLPIDNSQASVTSSDKTQGSFAETLENAIQSVNQLQKAADKSAQDLATGRTDNVQDVMIAAEKADIALKVMVQVRNKIVDAYQEIMRMQV